MKFIEGKLYKIRINDKNEAAAIKMISRPEVALIKDKWCRFLAEELNENSQSYWADQIQDTIVYVELENGDRWWLPSKVLMPSIRNKPREV